MWKQSQLWILCTKYSRSVLIRFSVAFRITEKKLCSNTCNLRWWQVIINEAKWNSLQEKKEPGKSKESLPKSDFFVHSFHDFNTISFCTMNKTPFMKVHPFDLISLYMTKKTFLTLMKAAFYCHSRHHL